MIRSKESIHCSIWITVYKIPRKAFYSFFFVEKVINFKPSAVYYFVFLMSEIAHSFKSYP